jgi:hypothetical protein
MAPSPRYCFCSPGGPPWGAYPGDRYCGLCGRELLAVIPRAPLLTAGPPVTVAAYLHPDGARWVGTVALELLGLLEAPATIRWAPDGAPAVRVVGHRRPSHTLRELSLQAPRTEQSAPGRLGRAWLTATLHGRPFELAVEVFGIDAPPRASLHLVRAASVSERASPPLANARGSDKRPCLVLAREAHAVKTFLQLEAGPGIPIQLDAVRCDHPAATVTLLHPVRARAPAVAEVVWDPARLAADAEEVVFQLSACGLPDATLRQRVRRELGRPVRFRPGALVVDSLAEDGPQTRLVQLTNEDSRPVVIRHVKPGSPWMAGATLPSALPLRLAPGASTTLRVDLHLQEVNGAPPPYHGQVALDLAERGRQCYRIRVESVRAPRRLAEPLLIDPGPPRVILARWDPQRRRLTYLPCSGDSGIEPEELGLRRHDYAAAVYRLGPAQELLGYLLAAARARCRMRDLLDFGSVRLCRHPWVPADFVSPGVVVCDWAALAFDRLSRLGPAPALLRVGLWDACLVPGPGQEPVPLLRPEEPAQSVGTALIRWLAERFVEGLRTRRGHLPPGLHAAAQVVWLPLACEAIVPDSHWGPAYTSRRLRRAARQAVPELGRVALDMPAARRFLVRAMADYAQQVCINLVRLGVGEGPGGLAVVGPLCGSPPFRGVLRSILTSAGFEAEFAADPWVAWLAPTETANRSAAPALELPDFVESTR